jgi:hypothetical protein
MTTTEPQSSTDFPFNVTKSSSSKLIVMKETSGMNGNSFSSSNGVVEQVKPSTSAASDYIEIPVVGLPGPIFTVLHSIALCGLSTSIVVSISLLVYLCTCRRKEKAHKQQPNEFKTPKSMVCGPGRQGTGGHRLEGSSETTSKTAAYKVESSLDAGEGGTGKTAPSKVTRSRVG